VPAPVLHELETSIVICSAGVSRNSETIIMEQQRNMAALTGQALESLHQLKADAAEMKDALLRGQILRMAEVLNRSWLSKKRTAAGISTDHIERIRGVAITNGAIAGKVSGAGGGGFMAFIAAHRCNSRP
jgi:D-glycero-alpha-D-manno-heptose-7-phosphate kinase